MKIAVTTTREAKQNLIAKAQGISEELGIPYINRDISALTKHF